MRLAVSFLIDFNSIKVRLEPIANVIIVNKNRNFNFIKVRLEQGAIDIIQALEGLFQFHKGTIRTMRSL